MAFLTQFASFFISPYGESTVCDADNLTVAYRYDDYPSYQISDLGFRVVRP